jgi:hypothetical protein
MVDLSRFAKPDLLSPWEACEPGLEDELKLELAP